MTIEELKRALVEVKEICQTHKCSKCPLYKTNGIYCPLIEGEDGVLDCPGEWDIDDWKEDSNATD